MSPIAGNPELFAPCKRFFFLSLLLTLLVIPIFVVAAVPTMNPAVHSKELASRVLLGVLFLGCLAALPALPRRGLRLPQVAILIFIAVNVLSTLLSTRAAYSFFESWHLWGITAIAVLIYLYSPRPAEFRKLLLVMVAAAVIAALYGIGVYFGIDPLRRWYPFAPGKQEGRNYIYSFLGNPEYFGGYMAPSAALAFAQVFRVRASLAARVVWVAICLMFLFALMLSGTRGASLGFLAAAALIVLSSLPGLAPAVRRRVVRLLWCVGAGVAVLLVVFSFPNPVNYRDFRLAKRFVDLFDITSASIRERILFFGVSGRMIADHPLLGDGPGTFRLNFYPYVERLSLADVHAGVQMMATDLQNRVAEHAHNDYLEFWCETGTIGLAALFFVLSVTIVEARRFPARRTRGTDESASDNDANAFAPTAHDAVIEELALYRTSFLAAAVCLFLNAAFSFPLHLPVRALFAWVALGCFFSASESLRELTTGRGEVTQLESRAGQA
jgi:O-antigen ligase